MIRDAPVSAERAKRVDPDLVAILSAAECDGDALVLAETLGAALYRRVDKVLAAIGGRWDKRRRAHVFDGCALAAIEPILVAGALRLPPDLGWFPTPPDLAAEFVRRAGVRTGWRVLEPSAGEGAIVRPLIAAGAEVHAMEIEPKRRAVLRDLLGDPVPNRLGGCFLERTSEPAFDAVVMNPPFAPRSLDVDHVLHALRFLAPGGRLLAVMSAGTRFRTDRKTSDFRDLVAGLGGAIEDLPDDSFAASGTRVRTVVVTVCKPRESARG